MVKKVKIPKGISVGRMITEIKPNALNFFNSYFNKIQVGLFKDRFTSKINGIATYKGNPIPDAQDCIRIWKVYQ